MEEFNEQLFRFFTGEGLIIARTIAILILGLLAVKIVLMLIRKAAIRAKIEKTASSFILSIVGVVLYFCLFLGVGKSAGISTASFVVIASAAGLALSLALQDSLSNLANGFIIVGSKPFVVGDYVDISGVSGSVQSIGIFNTKLTTPDNKTITLPNSKVIGSSVINYSTSPTRRMDVDVVVKYDTDIKKAKKVLMDAGASFGEVLSAPAPQAVLTEYLDSGIKMSYRAWVPTEAYWDVKYQLNEKVLAAFDKNGIQIPFNTIDVNILDNKGGKQ